MAPNGRAAPLQYVYTAVLFPCSILYMYSMSVLSRFETYKNSGMMKGRQSLHNARARCPRRAGAFRRRHRSRRLVSICNAASNAPHFWAIGPPRRLYLLRIASPAIDAARRKRAFQRQTVPTKFRCTGGGVDFAQTSRGWQSAGDRTCAAAPCALSGVSAIVSTP